MTTSAYRPQGNGVVERIHGFIRPALAIAVQRSHDAWDERIPAIAFAYRATEIAGTSFTPFKLLCGREPQLTHDLKHGPPAHLQTDLSEYAARLQEILGSAYSTMRLQTERMKTLSMERRATDKQLPPHFNMGDTVCVWRPSVAHKGSHKLTYKWQGPNKVVLAKHPHYMVQSQVTNRRRMVHAEHIRPMAARKALLSDRQPMLPNPQFTAPQTMTQATSAINDMVISKVKGDGATWRLARVEDTESPTGRMLVHLFSHSAKAGDPLTATWLPAYFDPHTGKDNLTHKPAPHLQPYLLHTIPAQRALHDVTMTKTNKLTAASVQRIKQSPTL